MFLGFLFGSLVGVLLVVAITCSSMIFPASRDVDLCDFFKIWFFIS